MPLTPQFVLAKQRDGEELSCEELEYFVNGLEDGEVSEGQAGRCIFIHMFILQNYIQAKLPNVCHACPLDLKQLRIQDIYRHL